MNAGTPIATSFAGLLLLAAAPAAFAQDTAAPAAFAQDTAAPASPRWAYEIRGGEFRPDLEQFSIFYGDADEAYYSLVGTYRFRDWLELGGEYGRLSAAGVGFLTSSQQVGGNVDYELQPFHVFASFVYERSARQRFVPYVGAGVAIATYEQKVELQEDIDGTTDAGFSLRLGLRVRLKSFGPVENFSYGSPYWRSYLLLEAQSASFEVEDVDLGGDALVLGFRMEFEL